MDIWSKQAIQCVLVIPVIAVLVVRIVITDIV